MGNYPTAAGAHREQLSGGKAGREENHLIAKDWTRARRMLAALFHPPQFLAREWIVRVCGLRAETDHLPAPVDPFDLRGRKRLARIAFVERLPVLVHRILEINRSLGLPNRLPGRLIERHHELTVAPVEVHQEQVAEQDRR